MPALLLSILGAVCAPAESDPPPAWSPDGHWVAYVTASRPADEVPPPGWLFGAAAPPEAGTPPSAGSYRLWSTHVESMESVALDESPLALTCPGWRADGTAMAFGRVQPVTAERARYEVVQQSAPESSKVLKSWDLGPDELGRLAGLRRARVVWSPDGRFVAVPDGDLLGLAVIRVDTGVVVRVISGAAAPAWSPDGSRLAFLRGDGVACVEANFAEGRRVAPLPNLDRLPPPAWSRDGQSILYPARAARRMQARLDAQGAETLSLLAMRVDQNRLDLAWDRLFDPLPGAEVHSIAFALDEDSGQLFFTAAMDQPHNQISRCFPRQRITHSRFHPYDESLPIWSLSAAPGGAKLGLRLGATPEQGLDAVCDPQTMDLSPLAPDEGTRARWIARLLGTIAELLAEHPARAADGRPRERVTLLPGPEELDASDFPVPRLRHLARLGRPLCARPPDDPARATLWTQARLVFDYLDIDRDAPASALKLALADLEPAEESVTETEQRLRLLGLRAQIESGLGAHDRAGAIVSYLRELAPGGETVVETGDGIRLVADSSTATAWLESLAESVGATGRTSEAAGPGDGRHLSDPNRPPPPPPAPGLRNERIDEIQVILPPPQVRPRPAVPFGPRNRMGPRRWP
jgi:hypothetical protein